MRLYRAIEHSTRRKVPFEGRVGELVLASYSKEHGFFWRGVETGKPCGAIAGVSEAAMSPVELAEMAPWTVEPISVLMDLGWLQSYTANTAVVAIDQAGGMDLHLTDEDAARASHAEWATKKRAQGDLPVMVWKEPGWRAMSLSRTRECLRHEPVDPEQLLEVVRSLQGFRRAREARVLQGMDNV